MRARGKRIGFVPTMGALHDGHLSLIKSARQRTDGVVASIFVNPLQFGPTEDFKRYPRPLRKDTALLHSAGTAAVFVPDVAAFYPPEFKTAVSVDDLGDRLEGAVRPGHFRGVTTVVMKLLQIVQPHVLYLGQKDFQQAVLLRRMILDLCVPVDVRVCPIVREKNGLAMSSRNAYLSSEKKEQAAVIRRGLQEGKRLLRNGEPARRVEARVAKLIQSAGLSVDYVSVADRESLEPFRAKTGQAVLLAAAKLSGVRLIDNVLVDVT